VSVEGREGISRVAAAAATALSSLPHPRPLRLSSF
jgi:hypothetical protein